jgi:2-polyprenyl-6-methoxyphenol hydroxylase-like FAD-dependent oxidoreductase
MSSTGVAHADVVVVGAGPTGLMLAGDLAEAGVRVTVLERRARESNVTRAFAVHARTMEELQIRGVADELAASGTTIQALRLYGRASIDLERLPSAFHSLLITPQFQTERVLTERLDRLGVSITHGAEVVGVTQDAAGVRSSCRRSVRSPDGRWAPTSGCTNRVSCRGSTATSDRFRPIGSGGCSWRETRRTAIRPPGARA